MDGGGGGGGGGFTQAHVKLHTLLQLRANGVGVRGVLEVGTRGVPERGVRVPGVSVSGFQ